MNILKLFRALGEAALEANLSKNEAKIFQHLINKTLTYYKISADQTDSTIVYFTGIRQDRATQAINSLIAKGFFTRTPVKIKTRRGWADGYRYRIAASFLNDIEPDFLDPESPKDRPPARPKNGDIQLKNNTNIKQHNKAATPESPENRRGGDLEKPQNIDANVYANLLPALSKLPNAKAQNVLNVLSWNIANGKVKTSASQLGGCLIGKAHAGLLDTTCLKIKSQQQQRTHAQQHQFAKVMQVAELNGLRQQAKLLGISLEQHAKNLNQTHLVSLLI